MAFKFGASRQTSGAFGASPRGFGGSGAGISFGTAGTASPVGFGAGAALGAQPLTALGGGTGGFGGGLGAGVSSGSAGTGGGIFGGSAAATPGAFGQRSTSTVAGTTTPTTFGFGSAGPAFGAQQPASSTTGFGGFGAPSTASQNTAFRLGQPQPTGGGPAGGFAFGSGTVGGAAGSSGGGTGNPPFQPEKMSERVNKAGIQRDEPYNVHVITAMPAYASKSQEELRVEDYQKKKAYGSQPAGGGGIFGGSQSNVGGIVFGGAQSSTGGAFGAMQPSGTGFGGTQQTSTFGQPLFGTGAKPNPFGSSQQSTVGGMFSTQPAAGAASMTFGSAPAAGGVVGGNMFGFAQGATGSSGMLGGTQAGTGGMFGSAQPTSGGILGSTQPTTTGGASSGGAFGTQTTSGGGMLGTKPSTGGMFGSGQPSAGGMLGSAQPATTGGMFGSTQPTTTGGMFGSSTQPTTTGGMFGSTPHATAGGMFGTSTQPTSGAFGTQPSAGMFGSTQPNAGSMFGGMQPFTAGGMFGSTQAANTGGMFGSTQPTNGGTFPAPTFGRPSVTGFSQPAAGDMFGASTASFAPGATSSFGTTAALPTAANGPGLGTSGATMQQQFAALQQAPTVAYASYADISAKMELLRSRMSVLDSSPRDNGQSYDRTKGTTVGSSAGASQRFSSLTRGLATGGRLALRIKPRGLQDPDTQRPLSAVLSIVDKPGSANLINPERLLGRSAKRLVLRPGAIAKNADDPTADLPLPSSQRVPTLESSALPLEAEEPLEMPRRAGANSLSTTTRKGCGVSE